MDCARTGSRSRVPPAVTSIGSAMTSIGSAVTSMAMGIRCAHVLVQGGGRWLRRWLFKLILLDWRRFCLLAGRRRYDPRL